MNKYLFSMAIVLFSVSAHGANPRHVARVAVRAATCQAAQPARIALPVSVQAKKTFASKTQPFRLKNAIEKYEMHVQNYLSTQDTYHLSRAMGPGCEMIQKFFSPELLRLYEKKRALCRSDMTESELAEKLFEVKRTIAFVRHSNFAVNHGKPITFHIDRTDPVNILYLDAIKSESESNK